MKRISAIILAVTLIAAVFAPGAAAFLKPEKVQSEAASLSSAECAAPCDKSAQSLLVNMHFNTLEKGSIKKTDSDRILLTLFVRLIAITVFWGLAVLIAYKKLGKKALAKKEAKRKRKNSQDA